jgi:hypothetical protein
MSERAAGIETDRRAVHVRFHKLEVRPQVFSAKASSPVDGGVLSVNVCLQACTWHPLLLDAKRRHTRSVFCCAPIDRARSFHPPHCSRSSY